MLLLDAALELLNAHSVLLATAGTILGIILGAIPGLNGPVGVAILLPLTYSMEPANGLILLGGIYMGSTFGGSVSSILLNCPGTGEASCTALDGYPMTRKGRAKEALYYSILSSSIGGLAGVLALLFFTPILAKFALKFGPPEMFMLTLAGLTIVGSLSGKSLSKGFYAVVLGLLISMVGVDLTTGGFRFTMGVKELRAGIPLIPLVVGLFAVTEMAILAGAKSQSFIDVELRNISPLAVLKSIFSRTALLIKACLLGVGIGILPGTGGAVSAFVCYGEAKRSSKDPDSFGKGNPEGIIAAESSNNGAVGGALIPLLALGIPGSATAAIMYGALTIHGLIPGPKLLTDNPEIAYVFMCGMLLTVIVMFVSGLTCVGLFAKVLKVGTKYIIPVVLVFSAIGVYSVRNSMFDVGVMVLFGALGLLFRKTGIPAAPILLGHILGPLLERNLTRTITLAGASDHNFLTFILSRPISAALGALFLILVYSNFKKVFKPARQPAHRRNPA